MAPDPTATITDGPPNTAATLTPGHTTQDDVEDGDYALASKYYNTEIQATKCALAYWDGCACGDCAHSAAHGC